MTDISHDPPPQSIDFPQAKSPNQLIARRFFLRESQMFPAKSTPFQHGWMNWPPSSRIFAPKAVILSGGAILRFLPKGARLPPQSGFPTLGVPDPRQFANGQQVMMQLSGAQG